MNARLRFSALGLFALLSAGCANIQMKLFTDARDPLVEYVLSGSGSEKIAVIPVTGVISDLPEWSLFRTRGSMVQEVVAHLDIAARDPDVKAIILKINSPGGTVTGSDILYHEIEAFKARTGKKVVALMMDIATSGGYYIALPADSIVAHPTTVTGSIGVIFLRPRLHGLMDKIGVEVEVSKSGSNKDMGSPFRPPSPEEPELFQHVIDQLGERFVGLVQKHRPVGESDLVEIRSARIFLSDDAKRLHLIDEIGYVEGSLAQARALAGLAESCRVVAYRRSYFPNDNLYNVSGAQFEGTGPGLVDLGVLNRIRDIQPGFHFLWSPGISH
jgi:protease-4